MLCDSSGTLPSGVIGVPLSCSPRCHTESQNVRGWKGPLWVIQSNPPAEAGSPTAGCTGPCPGGSWISPEKETPRGDNLLFCWLQRVSRAPASGTRTSVLWTPRRCPIFGFLSERATSNLWEKSKPRMNLCASTTLFSFTA